MCSSSKQSRAHCRHLLDFRPAHLEASPRGERNFNAEVLTTFKGFPLLRPTKRRAPKVRFVWSSATNRMVTLSHGRANTREVYSPAHGRRHLHDARVCLPGLGGTGARRNVGVVGAWHQPFRS